MGLLKIFYSPGTLFREIRGNGWGMPLVASMVLFLASAAIAAQFIGSYNVVQNAFRRISPHPTERPSPTETPQSTILISIGLGALANSAGVFVYAAMTLLTIRLIVEPAAYRIVLTVCAYASYVSELANLFVRVVVVAYCRVIGRKVVNGDIFRVDATLLLVQPTGARLRSLASSMDVFAFIFIAVIAFGLTKSDYRIPFKKSALAAMVPWLAWTLIKLF